MPFLIAIAIHLTRILRRPIDRRLKQRQAGPLTVTTGAVLLLITWDRAEPAGITTVYFLGELAGVGAVYLMTWALILATRLRPLERWFGGLDRMYLWHKRYAVWSMLLLLPHVFVTGRGKAGMTPEQATAFTQTGRILGAVSFLALVALVLISIPRISRILHLGYGWWLFLHRLTGLLLMIALVHGWALDRVIGGSAVLRTIYLAIAAAGLVAYGYDELVQRRRAPQADYEISRIDRPSPEILDVTLTPTGDRSPLKGGQFVYLHVGGDDAWREHPFSVAGAGSDGSVRLTIRTLGQETRRMHADLRPGLPATITGPYGMFDHTLGGPRQIWIAGGIGIAPFLGWLTTPGLATPEHVDLFYCTPNESDAVFLPELTTALTHLPGLAVHPIYSRQHGRLTADRITALTGPLPPDTHVFLCGPAPMVDTLTHDLNRLGLSRDHIHTEHFAFR
ncbi:ferredoxin reductase family protein [Streptomyces puniciscabiei]